MGYHGLEPANSFSWLPGYRTLEWQRYSGYCNCLGQGTTLINTMPSCEPGLVVCPNAYGGGANEWDPAMETAFSPDCPTELPRLPWFESCSLRTFLVTWATMTLSPFSRSLKSSTSTFCQCNKVGHTSQSETTWVVETVPRECDGGYICANSVGFVTGEAAKKRTLDLATTATATSPVLAVTTDATPGSVPTTAAEPTVLMAE